MVFLDIHEKSNLSEKKNRFTIFDLFLVSHTKDTDTLCILSCRYYYNHMSKVSTWVKPAALHHVIFANPTENEIRDRVDTVASEPEQETVGGFLDNIRDLPGTGV